MKHDKIFLQDKKGLLEQTIFKILILVKQMF